MLSRENRINVSVSCVALLCGASAAALLPVTALAQSPVFDDPVVMPVTTNAPVKNIFVPVGFDDNDTVEVIVHGHFHDSCNKMGPVIGVVDDEKKTVEIAARALRYQGNVCIPMEVPFMQSVKLGQLAAGQYKVQLKGARGQPDGAAPVATTLDVAKATSSTADDNLYAPVDDVSFEPAQEGVIDGNYKLTLSGIFPRSEAGCMVLTDVKVLSYPQILVVLPVARFESNPELCDSSLTPFGRTFRVTKDVKLDLKRDTLIHVRVLNGQSVNRVIEFEN